MRNSIFVCEKGAIQSEPVTRKPTPPAVGPCFHRNFICRGFGSGQNQLWLTNPNPKPTPAWLGGGVRRPRAIAKKHALLDVFLNVFHVFSKYQNDAIFVHIEGLRPCLSKPSYGAPNWALLVRLISSISS